MLRRAVPAVWIAAFIVLRAASAWADAAEVEALIAKGNELRMAGTPGPALPYFHKAYELERTPRTTAQLGLAELAAGYPVEASEHLAAALQSPDDPSIAKYRQVLGDALSKAQSRIGELAVEGSPAGAEVVVDGRTLGTLPLPAPVKLPARLAELVVRAPGYSPRTEQVPIAAGQRHRVTVALDRIQELVRPSTAASPNPGSAAKPASTGPSSFTVIVNDRSPADVESGSGLRSAAWITGVAAVAAAATGLAFNVVTRSDTDDAAWHSHRLWSIAGYVSGGALAATSLVLFLASASSSTRASTHALLTCAPTLNGVGCGGVF